MSAIKQYFDNQRAAKIRQRERRIERADQRRQERLERIEFQKKAFEEEFSEIDTALRMNEFISEEEVVQFVWETYDDVFNKIMENINTYPDFIREVLTQAFNRSNLSNGKIKLVELTDEDMEKRETQKQKELDAQFEKEWQKYKKETGLSRPEGSVDEKYTELYEKLQKLNKEFDDETKKPKEKKYVPIHLRGKETTTTLSEAEEKLQKQIKETQNEIEEVKKQIQQEEQNWENGKRKENQNKILNKMFGV